MASQICYFFTVLVDVSASRLALVPLDSVVLILLLFRLVQCNLKFQIQNTSLVLSNSNSTAVIHVVSLEILKCEPSRPLNCKPLLFECSSFCHDYFFLFMFFNVILNLRHLLCLFHCSSQKKLPGLTLDCKLKSPNLWPFLPDMFFVDTHTLTPQKLSTQLLSCGTSNLSQVPIVLMSKQGFFWVL